MNIAIKAGSLEFWSETGDFTPNQDIILVDRTLETSTRLDLWFYEELTPHVFKVINFLGE